MSRLTPSPTGGRQPGPGSTLPSCSCCPYGYHIDVDFVHYCERLLAALQDGSRSSTRAKNLARALSLPARRGPSQRPTVLKNTELYCDLNGNTNANNASNNNNSDFGVRNQRQQNQLSLAKLTLKSLPTPTNGHDVFFADNQLGDAVARFEEAWCDTKKPDDCQGQGCDDNRQYSGQWLDSPPASPAPSSCTSSTISKVVLSQIRDQMAMSLTRMKELEEQVREVPQLRQKVMVLKEEKKQLMRRLEGDDDDKFDGQKSRSRVAELVKSGFITPPMMRRKFLMTDSDDGCSDEFDTMFTRASPPPNRLISSKNIRLDQLTFNSTSDATNQTSPNLVQAMTNTDDDYQRPASVASTEDSSTNTEGYFSKCLTTDFQSPISIPPTCLVMTRSVGVSTNLAPSLPRRSVSVSTDLSSSDVASVRELERNKPILVNWGTDPVTIDRFDAQCQARPTVISCGTRTEAVSKRSFGTNTVKQTGPRTWVRGCQTDKKYTSEKMIQVTHDCPRCELRQTETVGVGDFDVRSTSMSLTFDKETGTDVTIADDLTTSPVSRAGSALSIRLCDKCNDSITSAARDVVIGYRDKSPDKSPTQSRIPRPVGSGGSPERRRVQDKIIEETTNEVLVYRDPALSPTRRLFETPPLPPPRRKEYTQKDIKAIDDIFKIISESDESDSSDEEATYEVTTGKVARISGKANPSQDIRSALKVLNDNLVKPERANKQVLDKSLAIIEKEWFKISAEKESDPHAVEDYLDLFESFSKHLLNRVVNLSDSSGNTAMHYAISHCNFDIVSVLLDSKVCDVNKQNKAGYTAIMLVALAKVETETQKSVVRRLFQLGDVNIKAKMNGQTALMLAASHGQFATCKLLLESGAAINVQDNDGSTALMCAAEHGHADVVRLLLSHPDCDPTLLDNDGSTALKIAMSKGRNDIGLMLYASTSLLSRGSSPYASLRRTQSKAVAASLRRTGSFSHAQPMASRTFHLAASPPSRSRHSSVKSSKSARN